MKYLLKFSPLLFMASLNACKNKADVTETVKPNIIVFIADDISWNDFGCYGNTDVKTPNIDELAANGIRFTNTYLSTSSCSPSRISILTGRYPHNTGAAELHTEPSSYLPSFPELFKKDGYHTISSGKWHAGEMLKDGFDIIQSDESIVGNSGEEMWVENLKNRPKEKPFMFWYAALDAHRDWGENNFSGTHNPDSITIPPFLADMPGTRSDLASYYDEITRFDNAIGEVVAELKAQSCLKNTILIIMADNGRPFPRSKTRLIDNGIKTPFIIYWEGLEKSKPEVSTSLISVIDLAPTLLNLANIKQPKTFQGRSFLDILYSHEKAFRNYAFAEHNWHDYEAHERMVRSDSFLYIRNSRPEFMNQGPADAVQSDSYQDLLKLRADNLLNNEQKDIFKQPRSKEELYNCTNDPYQLKNLINDERYAKTAKKHKQILNTWMKDTDDNVPDNLTPDWYHRFTGLRLSNEPDFTKGDRREMPGKVTNAISNTNTSAF